MKTGTDDNEGVDDEDDEHEEVVGVEGGGGDKEVTLGCRRSLAEGLAPSLAFADGLTPSLALVDGLTGGLLLTLVDGNGDSTLTAMRGMFLL